MSEHTITKTRGRHLTDEEIAALDRKPSTEQQLARVEPKVPEVVITNEQTDLIRATIAKDATEAELRLFFYDCRRRGVHPLDKLIHFTKRRGKYTPVTSIDFFRSRAAATREHMGTDDAVFYDDNSPNFRATVTVYRWVAGEKVPFPATARWFEYLPEPASDPSKGDPQFMWNKMPHAQLAKCAEALALRKAFPQELADLHTFEEMDRARSEADVATSTPEKSVGRATIDPPQRKVDAPAAKISDAQDKRFYAIAMKAGWEKDQLKAWLKKKYGVEHSRDLTRDVYDAACTAVQRTGGDDDRDPGQEG